MQEETGSKAQETKERSDINFRVRGIPSRYRQTEIRDKETIEIIETGLNINRDFGLKIWSLTYSYDNSKKELIATITFATLPTLLLQSVHRDEREFSVLSSDLQFGEPSSEFEEEDIEIVFDTHFRGWTPLGPNLDVPKYDVDCIVVPGLGGHAFGSFKARGKLHMWLRDSLARDFPNIRTLIYGYQSSLPGSRSIQNLSDIAGRLRNHVLQLRANSNRLVPIILIGHSLGGLVIKEALIQMYESKDDLDKATFEAAYGALFFGVPNQGMDITSLMPMVQDQPNEGFLHSLTAEGDYLRKQANAFQVAFSTKKFDILCFYETEQTPTWEKRGDKWRPSDVKSAVLVNSASATHTLPWTPTTRLPQAIPQNHSDIVKFNKQDENYELVKFHFNQILKAALDDLQLHHKDRAQSSAACATTGSLTIEEQECLESLAYPELFDHEPKMEHQVRRACRWLLEDKTYQEWLKVGGLVWVKGKAGSGKSTIFRFALGRDRKHSSLLGQNIIILSHSFRTNGSPLQSNREGLFRSLLHQLLEQVPQAMSLLTQSYQEKKNDTIQGSGSQWQKKELRNLLTTCIARLDKEYTLHLFIDALDECEEGHAIERLVNYFDELVTLRTAAKSQLHVFFTCRLRPILVGKVELRIQVPEREDTTKDNQPLSSSSSSSSNKKLIK